MAASLSGNEVVDSESSGLPWNAKVSSLPPTLTLTGKKILLKTPTPQDDAAMCQIFSDPLTVQYLPQFHRPGGWTQDEMVSRRVKLTEARAEGKGLTLFIHLLGNNKKDGDEYSRAGPDEDEEQDLILAGTTGFRTVNLQCGTGEIGIILHNLYWRKGIATEAMYLCLRYAFDSLGLQRVDWFTSAANKDMRGWCEDFLQMTPFEISIDELGPAVGYSLVQSEWQSRVSQFLEQKVSSRNS